MNALNKIAVLSLCGMLFAGCSTTKMHEWLRADPPDVVSDFLPRHDLLVRQSDTFPFHFFFKAQNLSRYKNVYVKVADTKHMRESTGWAYFDEKMSGTFGTSIDELAVFARDAFVAEFKDREDDDTLHVVDSPDQPKTLIIEPAIIAVKPSKAELNAAGLAGSFFIPGLDLVTSYVSEGMIVVECRIRDAKTGEVVAMFSDAETDPKALISTSSLTWMASSKINLKKLACYTADVLEEDNPLDVKRDYPLQFFSFIYDSTL